MKFAVTMVVLSLLLAISACTPVSVIQLTRNTRIISTDASNKNKAIEIATYRATRICAMKNQEVKITNLDVTYRGLNTSQQKLIELAKNFLPESKTSVPYSQNEHAYRVTLTFRCV